MSPLDRTEPAEPSPQRIRVTRRGASAWVAAALLSGCRSERQAYRPTYSEAGAVGSGCVLAVHPLYGPKRLFEVYQPLVDHLNRGLAGLDVRLEASSDYAAFERKLASRQVQIALPNPYQTLQAITHGYRVFAKMGDDEDFRGIFVVRRDGGINQPRDLIGKAVSYPAPTALAATLLPQRWLHDQGVRVLRDLDNRYVGTQESSIMNVALGRTAAGATWPQPWRLFQKEHPLLAAQLEVKWETPHLINNALVARGDLPEATVERVAAMLTGLHETSNGREILARMELDRFDRASDRSYAKVQRFIDDFDREVRPLKGA